VRGDALAHPRLRMWPRLLHGNKREEKQKQC